MISRSGHVWSRRRPAPGGRLVAAVVGLLAAGGIARPQAESRPATDSSPARARIERAESRLYDPVVAGLRDLSARVRVDVAPAGRPPVAVTGAIFWKAPDRVAAEVDAGRDFGEAARVTLLDVARWITPPRFSERLRGYRLREVDDRLIHGIATIPVIRATGIAEVRIRFREDGLVGSLATVPSSTDQSTRGTLEYTWAAAGDRFIVSSVVERTGSGDDTRVEIDYALREGLTLVSRVVSTSPSVRTIATLTEHRVNPGLADSLFPPRRP